ncbi:hypothetical protein AKJ09_08150 [Labilithrix luteola]|uniref:Lipoprotein n=1 Tax=Labilithrix luteola TaxID=1391654 RepID=A0A0K1Q751_9BACT|nr:hypothetical protein [Labilithrix luteola]AKV01487.1 hypothetical protein AKJ09_08150 [Labilithrix luteola]
MKSSSKACAWGVFASLVVAACKPSLDDDRSRVDRPRILAVQSEPAEAKPGESVVLRALYTDGSQQLDVAPVAWGFCATRPALDEPTALSAACLSNADGGRTSLGAGITVNATIPSDVCRLFGPDRPLGKPGEPAGRPADPDSTGGYYQPGVVGGAGLDDASFDVRVRCGLPGATQAIVAELERRYRPNVNPKLAAVRAGSDAIADGGSVTVARGASLRIRAEWPACGDDTCEGAESYVVFDPAARVLVPRREAMRVAWLATAGHFEEGSTGREESDLATDTENGWTAPDEAGDVTLWLVLRDSRGGVSFRSIRVRVG